MQSFDSKFAIARRLARIGMAGAALFLVGVVFRFVPFFSDLVIAIGVVAAVPFLLFAYVLTILHWKARYRGKHSDLWGIFLILELSGWSKLIYFFRHVLPDMRKRGRYSSAYPEA